MTQRILIYVLLVAALGGGAYWYFVLQAPAEDEITLAPTAAPNEATPGAAGDADASGDAASGGDDAAGGAGTSAGADAGAGGAGGDAGAPASGGDGGSGIAALATGKTAVQLDDGSARGNNASAVEVAGVVVAAGTQQSVALEASAMTVPAAGPSQLTGGTFDKWRKNVDAASLQVRFADSAGTSEWQSAKPDVRRELLDSWLKLLSDRYPNAHRSVTLASDTGALLASADQGGGAGKPTYSIA